MLYSLMGKMRLPFIDSDLLYTQQKKLRIIFFQKYKKVLVYI
jgi:hypothetical protein